MQPHQRSIRGDSGSRISHWLNATLTVLALCALATPTFAQTKPLKDADRVYVPIEELDSVLARDKKGVILSRDEFEKLVEKAKTSDGSPAKLIVSGVDYEARIKGSQLLIDVNVNFEHFAPGWHKLALPTAGLAIESAKLGDKQPPLGRTSPAVAYLLSNEPGEHTLNLTLSAPLASVGSDQVATFGLLNSPSATFKIAVPDGKQLAVDGLMMERGNGDSLTFPVGGRGKLELRITESKRKQAAEALVFMSTAYGVNVAPSEITWQAVTTLRSFGESLDRFVFTVPRTLEIAAVESTGLEAWELADSADGKSTEITLTYRQPIEGSRKITFRGVMSVPVNEQWRLPGLRLNKAASEIGRVIVQHPVGTRLVIEKLDGIRRTADTSKSQLAQASFDVWQPGFDLQLRLQLREREVLANMSTILDVAENDVRLESLTGIECLNSPLFEVVTSLPTNWEPTAITINGQPARWQTVPGEDDQRQFLRVPFPTPLKPGAEYKLSVNAVHNLETDDAGATQFDVPEVAIEGAGVVEGVILVRCQDWLRVAPEELEGLDPAVLPNTKSEHPGFRYQEPGYSGTINSTPKATRITAWTQSFTRLDPERAVTWMDLHLEVAGGGLREMTVKLPESVGEKLRFAITQNCAPAARIREQIAQDVADGQRTWLVRFDRRVRGNLTLGAFMEEDRADGGNAVPEAIVDAADRQYGYIAVEASGEQHLTLNFDQQAELQNVDPVDLPDSRYQPKERIVAAYRYVRPGFDVTATEERFDREAVPTAVCRSMHQQTVVDQTGTLRNQTVMQFVAVGVQNLRMSLPDGADLWSTELDGKPVEVRRDDNTYMVPLKRTNSPTAARTLKVTYESFDESLSVLGQLTHSAPTFAVDISGAEQPMEMLQRNWDVVHSADTVFDASSGLFEPAKRLGEDSILAQIPDMLTLPTKQNAADKLMAIGGVLLLILIPTLILRRWGWPGFGVCLGLGFVAVVFVALLLQMGSSREHAGVSVEFAANATPATVRDSAFAPAESASEQGESSSYDEEAEHDVTPPVSSDPFQDKKGLPAPVTKPDFDFSVQDEDRQQAVPPLPPFGQNATPQKRTARLSVPVDFEVPESYVTTQFAYSGTGGGQIPDLDLRYHGRELNTIAPIAVALFVMLWFWFARSRSFGYRAFLVAVGLLIPMAVASLVPSLWQMALEGIFFGTLGGIALWFLHWVLNIVKRLPVSRAEVNSTAILLVLLVPSIAFAQDNKTQKIVVPYDDNGEPLESSRVFIPQATFLKLWRQANPDKALANAPVEGMVSSVDYSAKLVRDGDSGHMQVRGRFVLHNFRDKQIQLALPLGEVAVEKAELNGETAPLRVIERTVGGESRSKSGQQSFSLPTTVTSLAIVVEERGDAVLDIDFVVPVKLTGPAGRFQLDLKPMASALMSFELPSDDLQLRVNGSSTAWRIGEGEGKSVEFPVAAGGAVTVEWQPKDEDSGVDRVIHTDVSTAAVINDAGLVVKSKLNYAVRQGTLSEIAFRVPGGVVLQQVTGADVGGWQIDDGNDGQTVRVFLRRTVDNGTSVLVELFSKPEINNEARSIVIPDVRPLEVTREIGQVGVFTDPAITIRTGDTEGATQIEPNAFPVDVRFGLGKRKPNVAYRYRVRPFSLSVSAVRPLAKMKAEAEHAVFIERRKLRYTTRFNLTPRGAPRARLAVVLPETFLPLEVFATNIADWYPYKDESGANLLIVDLNAPTLNAIELVITGSISREPDAVTVSIPVPRMSAASQAFSQLGIRADESYNASVMTSLKWKSVDPNTISGDIRRLSKSKIRFAFNSDDLQPDAVNVELTKMPATLFGETVSVISLTNTSIEYSLNLKWIVRQSATDRFAFSAPDWLAGKLELRGDGLRQVIESEPADGRVTWTLVLQEPRSANYFALATATFPPTFEENLRTPKLRCEPGNAETNPIEVQNHYAVVMNQSERLITPVGDAMKTVEPDELQIKIPKQYLDRATQIVRVLPNAAPTWSVTTPERREGAPATVNLLDLRTVVAVDGSYRTKSTLTLRNRTRQFLPLILPEGSGLLSVFVKGEPARPVMTNRNGRKLHLIALPRTSEADLSFNVEVVTSGTIPGANASNATTGFHLIGQEVSIPVPEVLSLRDDEEFGIPVAMSVWKVHVPESWHASLMSGSSNVTKEDEEASDVIRMMSSLKEAVSQSYTLSSVGGKNGNSAFNKQVKAYDNLKEAEKQLEFQARDNRNEEVQKQLSELRSNVRNLQRQLADQGVSFNADQTKARSDGKYFDTTEAKDFIQSFNDSLITGNGASTGENALQLRDQEFKLNLRNGDGETTPNRAAAKKRAIKGKQQSRNRSGSKSLGNLNSQIYRVDVPQQEVGGEATRPNSGAVEYLEVYDLGGKSSNPIAQTIERIMPGKLVNADTYAGKLHVRGNAAEQRQIRALVDRYAGVRNQPGGGDRGGFGGGEFGNSGPGGGAGGYGSFGGAAGSGIDQKRSPQLGQRPIQTVVPRPNVLPNPFNDPGQLQLGGQAMGNTIMQPLDDLGAVVIKGSQSDIDAVIDELQEQGRAPVGARRSTAEWTRTGGLSLPIDVSSETESLNFSKVGGTPKLTLRVRPADTLKKGYGLIWAVIWIGLALAALIAYRRGGATGLWQFVPTAITLLGVLGFVLLTDASATVAFVVFSIGAILMAIASHQRNTTITR